MVCLWRCDQMCESRMVCLPKPGKLRHGNAASVQDTRPITVLSILYWWRLWSSAWTRGVVRGWMRSHIPRDFAVAHAVSTGEVVVDFLDLLEHGYMMSLDFSKAFDCLDPLAIREVLLRLGWDPRVVAVFTAVWSRQERRVIYQSHSALRSHKPLATHSVSRLSYLFARLDLLSSETFSFLIFFLLLFSSLLFSSLL